MRRITVLLAMVGALSLTAAPAVAVPRHEHNLTTPGGTHVIAGGVTHQAPCTAFLNFHGKVHVGVFVEGNNPHTLTPTFIDGTC